MKVRVLAFGHYRDILPEPMELTMSQGAIARDVAELLGASDARLLPLGTHCRVAVNAEYAHFETLLHDGDEVVFIPPMSGG